MIPGTFDGTTPWRAGAADVADRVATRDCVANADLTVSVARMEASALIRDGQPGRAVYTLTRAVQSAARQLGLPVGGAS